MSETVLFATNGDGTVNCAWCDEEFDAELARPDGQDEPICPTCYIESENETAQLSRTEYIEELHMADGALTPAQLAIEADKFGKWKRERGTPEGEKRT